MICAFGVLRVTEMGVVEQSDVGVSEKTMLMMMCMVKRMMKRMLEYSVV